MKRFKIESAFVILIISAPTLMCQSPQPSASATVERDQSAISVINQALATAGTAQVLQVVHGMTGSGTITLNVGSGLQGTITIRRLDGRRFRSDITLENGVRTAIADGGSEVVRDERGFIRSHASQGAVANEQFIFPYTQLLLALADSSICVIDLGIITHQNQAVHAIRTQKIFLDGSDPQGHKASLSTHDYFLDPNSLQILSIMDSPTARSVAQGPLSLTHEVQFSGYQPVSGILVPFSSTELVNGQELSTITLQNVNLNAQFASADFSF